MGLEKIAEDFKMKTENKKDEHTEAMVNDLKMVVDALPTSLTVESLNIVLVVTEALWDHIKKDSDPSLNIHRWRTND